MSAIGPGFFQHSGACRCTNMNKDNRVCSESGQPVESNVQGRAVVWIAAQKGHVLPDGKRQKKQLRFRTR